MDMNPAFTPSVSLALEQITLNFPDSRLEVTPDGNGGAWFVLHDVPLGAPYVNEKVWVGGDISPQWPYADLYPLFVSPDLERIDRRPLGEATSTGVNFHGRTAVQISRRSNHRDPRTESAVAKIQKVLSWLKR